jgi:endonuclease YncB( thermonuclease family)
MRWKSGHLFGLLSAVAMAPAAHADPCEAPLPLHAGTTFTGTVRYVGDGDSLCVGQTPDPNEWIEVRLSDFNAPELHAEGGEAAKTALIRLAFGRQVTCMAQRGRKGRVISFDRVIALCRIGPRSVGDLLREETVVEGGN